jgi:hypothetical protein
MFGSLAGERQVYTFESGKPGLSGYPQWILIPAAGLSPILPRRSATGRKSQPKRDLSRIADGGPIVFLQEHHWSFARRTSHTLHAQGKDVSILAGPQPVVVLGESPIPAFMERWPRSVPAGTLAKVWWRAPVSGMNPHRTGPLRLVNRLGSLPASRRCRLTVKGSKADFPPTSHLGYPARSGTSFRSFPVSAYFGR